MIFLLTISSDSDYRFLFQYSQTKQILIFTDTYTMISDYLREKIIY